MGLKRLYNAIDYAQSVKLRGLNQQTQTGLLWATPNYKQNQVGGINAPTTGYLQGLALGSFAIHNRSGTPSVVGIGVRIPNYLWKAGQWTNATTTYTDGTTAAQNTTTDDFALETAATNNDGYVILSRVAFNAVSINISTADTGGTPVRAVRLSDSTGAAWASALTNLYIGPTTAANYSTGENLVVFGPPPDWGKSVSLATTLPDGYYAMNVRSTTAPTNAALAKAIEIFRLYYLTANLANNAILEESLPGSELVIGQDPVEGWYGDSLVALISTSDPQNRVSAQVRAI